MSKSIHTKSIIFTNYLMKSILQLGPSKNRFIITRYFFPLWMDHLLWSVPCLNIFRTMWRVIFLYLHFENRKWTRTCHEASKVMLVIVYKSCAYDSYAWPLWYTGISFENYLTSVFFSGRLCTLPCVQKTLNDRFAWSWMQSCVTKWMLRIHVGWNSLRFNRNPIFSIF
jgi:hypothetical protein